MASMGNQGRTLIIEEAQATVGLALVLFRCGCRAGQWPSPQAPPGQWL